MKKRLFLKKTQIIIKKSKEESIRKIIKILLKSFPRIIFQNTKMKDELIKDHEDHFVESI